LEKDPDVSDGARFETFRLVDELLGLDLLRDVGRAPAVVELPEGAQALLDERAAARAAKDWAQSDALRDALAALGVIVKDTPEGQQTHK
jgi:cysteinyl-tRNA synthetase